MNLSNFRQKLETVEETEREQLIKSAWASIENKKESIKLAYPGQEVDIAKFFVEMILKESSLVKLTDRLYRIVTNDTHLKSVKDSAKKDAELKKFRSVRNGVLADTDWMLLPDAPVEKEKRSKVLKYRKYLRDLPELVKKGIQDKLEVMSFEQWDSSPLNKS